MSNVLAFRVLLGTSFGPIVAQRLVGTLILINEAGSAEVHITADEGANYAMIPPRGQVRLEGVDLAALQAKSNVVSTPLSVFFTSTR
jgi:hypothetical protein